MPMQLFKELARTVSVFEIGPMHAHGLFVPRDKSKLKCRN